MFRADHKTAWLILMHILLTLINISANWLSSWYYRKHYTKNISQVTNTRKPPNSLKSQELVQTPGQYHNRTDVTKPRSTFVIIIRYGHWPVIIQNIIGHARLSVHCLITTVYPSLFIVPFAQWPGEDVTLLHF